MAIFSRLKGHKPKAANANDTIAKEDTAVPFHERALYVPKHAVRDAMHCTPGGPKREHREAMMRAHEERAARIEYEQSMHQYALSNPKLVISRGSSSPSTPYTAMSAASSARITDPMSSNASSFSDLAYMASSSKQPTPPQLPRGVLRGGQSRPHVSSSSTSSLSSTAQSTPPLASLDSVKFGRSKGKMPVTPHSEPLSLPDLGPSFALPSPRRENNPPPFLSHCSPLSTDDTWAALSLVLAGETADSVVDHDKSSTQSPVSQFSDSSSSIYSFEVDGRRSVTPPRFDSTQPSPEFASTDKFYPLQARKLDKAPVMIEIGQRPAPKPAGDYFEQPMPSRYTQAASPSGSVDGPSIPPTPGSSPGRRRSLSRQTMINAF